MYRQTAEIEVRHYSRDGDRAKQAGVIAIALSKPEYRTVRCPMSLIVVKISTQMHGVINGRIVTDA